MTTTPPSTQVVSESATKQIRVDSLMNRPNVNQVSWPL
jgi:hypothetical protein